MALDAFCDSPFWDLNQTWNTSDPDLSFCFQQTVLVWFPCFFFWIFAGWEVYSLVTTKLPKIPFSWVTYIKIILIFVIIAAILTDYFDAIYRRNDGQTLAEVYFYTPIIKFITLLAVLILMTVGLKRGRRTSGVIFNFWLIFVFCGIFIFSSNIRNAIRQHHFKPSTGFVTSTVVFAASICLLLLSFCPDIDRTVLADLKEKKICPEEYTSFISQIWFSWMDNLMWRGFRRPLEEKELWDLPENCKTIKICEKFDYEWRKEELKATRTDTRTEPVSRGSGYESVPSVTIEPVYNKSLGKTLWRTFGGYFVLAVFCKFIGDMLGFASPVILKWLIKFVENKNEPFWHGYVYAALMSLAVLFESVAINQNWNLGLTLSVKVHSAIIAAVYRKALRISNSSKQTSTTGEIVNLMSVDAEYVADVVNELPQLFTAPIQLIVALYLMWNILGVAVFFGLGVFIFLIPLNLFLSRYIEQQQTKSMEEKDERIKVMNEILAGIRVLKLYAWELPFQTRVNIIRGRELACMRRMVIVNSIIWALFNSATIIVSLSMFASYILLDKNHVLDASTAFVSLSLLNILKEPLSFTPMIITFLIQMTVSLRRLDKFLNSEEVDPDQIKHETRASAVVLEEATFAWAAEGDAILSNISIKIPRGSLVGVVGTVGSGKSSLMSAILGEMEKREGEVNTSGRIAYAAQQAWIRNATLKDNVLFGRPYDEQKYNQIIDGCALRPDLAILPGGDATEIGEKGINLSGGQKQRVSLARAVYNMADIYLLDDPLSAVDSHVGKHIFEEVIGPNGILKKKTRILVTHSILHLPRVDWVIVLAEGAIKEQGTYEQLMELKGTFAELVKTYGKEEEEKELAENVGQGDHKRPSITPTPSIDIENASYSRQASVAFSVSSVKSDEGSNPTSPRRSSFPSRQISHFSQVSQVSHDGTAEVMPNTALTTIEEMETGKVGWPVYGYYFRSIGSLINIITFFVFACAWAASTGGDVWVSIWSNDRPGEKDKTSLRLGVYGGLGFLQILFMYIGYTTAGFGMLAAGRRLHRNLLANILRLSLSFFDTTPVGRIVNRFSSDVATVDTILPNIIIFLSELLFQVFITIIIICVNTPTVLAIFVPLGVVYYIIQTFFISTSRQLKRIESTSRSPIYSHFSETITGLSTIRAYQLQDVFAAESRHKVDTNNRCVYLNYAARRWLTMRLDFVANIVIFSTSIFAIQQRDKMEAGTLGLIITYAVNITFLLNWTAKMASELETYIVAVERIKDYTETPTEAAWEIKEKKPNDSWPNEGLITFSNYSTRYREGLDLVLKSIHCHIQSGEKIGIVGRTGAGKSSLTLALFRLIEPSDGEIIIDGINISELGLRDLRSRITIIPQDPVLFCGSLRMNLDPFELYSDPEVWMALEHSHLKRFVEGLAAGLDHEIKEGGENLSVGQRQLVCLARALLRKTKVLVLDEATAAIDLETDDLIQATIRKEFADCTVITIAHRINTIMDSSRVMVLEKGSIKEMDSPAALLADQNSEFYSLAKEAGIT